MQSTKLFNVRVLITPRDCNSHTSLHLKLCEVPIKLKWKKLLEISKMYELKISLINYVLHHRFCIELLVYVKYLFYRVAELNLG